MRYEVQGHSANDRESYTWDSSYAGEDTIASTYEEAEAFVRFLLAEYPQTTPADWRIVERDD